MYYGYYEDTLLCASNKKWKVKEYLRKVRRLNKEKYQISTKNPVHDLTVDEFDIYMYYLEYCELINLHIPIQAGKIITNEIRDFIYRYDDMVDFISIYKDISNNLTDTNINILNSLDILSSSLKHFKDLDENTSSEIISSIILLHPEMSLPIDHYIAYREYAWWGEKGIM